MRFTNTKGFTLIELILVVFVITSLAGGAAFIGSLVAPEKSLGPTVSNNKQSPTIEFKCLNGLLTTVELDGKHTVVILNNKPVECTQ